MADIPRLNGVIKALEAGQPTFTAFATPDVPSAVAFSGNTDYDGIVFEMEHNPWDGPVLRDCLQYMLNRGQIAKAASIAPIVTPITTTRNTATSATVRLVDPPLTTPASTSRPR